VKSLKSFVVVNTELGAEREVAEKLKKIVGVEKVELVYGVYDIVMVIKAPTRDETNGITFKIRHIDGVLSTLCMDIIP
jgi:DNA-binding Lrp family transcriptional regulator